MNLRRRQKPPAQAPEQLAIPATVRACLRPTVSNPQPEKGAGLWLFLMSLDLTTAPADETLVDLVLLAITTPAPESQDLPAWTSYALTAARQLHPDDHPRTRRARLAHAAVMHGILPGSDTAGSRDESDVAHAVRHCLTDTTAQPVDHDPGLTSLLTAYTGLHAHGLCDDAITETEGILAAWQPRPHLPGGLPAIVIVLIALLTGCDRHHDARRVLDDHRHLLDPTHSIGRDLFAACALSVMDQAAAGHRHVCTTTTAAALGRDDQQPYDRNTWSALLHGEHPDQHVSPLPAPPRPHAGPADTTGATTPPATSRPSLSELPRRVTYPYRDRHRQPRQHPPMMHATRICLVCDNCRLALDLGDTTVHPSAPHTPISPITLDGQPAWHHPALRLAIWRLLTDHLGHQLRTVTHTSPAWATHTTMDLIGRPAGGAGTSHQAYTGRWPQHPAPPGHRGATPQPATAEPDNTAYLLCLDCNLDLELGTHTTHPDNPHTTAITIAGGLAADQHTATTAVIRMLTDHTGHQLRADADDYTWLAISDTQEWAYTIRADPDDPTEFGDITHEQYTAGWPYNPGLPRYRGFDPIDGLPTSPTRPARRATRPSHDPADIHALDPGADQPPGS